MLSAFDVAKAATVLLVVVLTTPWLVVLCIVGTFVVAGLIDEMPPKISSEMVVGSIE